MIEIITLSIKNIVAMIFKFMHIKYDGNHVTLSINNFSSHDFKVALVSIF